MTTMLLDASTGFISEEELEAITETPGGSVGEDMMPIATSVPCAISATVASVTAISAAWGDGCPTTVCTSRC
ncbi:hypothetical protein ACFVWN_18910 [Nocardiopsis flavescens]|uniref:Uncharacterized protein n=1 Tax=Nocardiopsis flavescens TaxID=758803 RepID=A0A1M6JLB7_9ACTN|nr:hypothetical protein [Nocardiopsis flavescens]SHJ47404.1 hypothetical protein SAMN05421803_106177 [Nocardiopsis flavescens]